MTSSEEKGQLLEFKAKLSKVKELAIYHWNKKKSKFTKKCETPLSKAAFSQILDILQKGKWIKISEQKVQFADEPVFALKSNAKLSIEVYFGISRFELDGYMIYYSKHRKLKELVRAHLKHD